MFYDSCFYYIYDMKNVSILVPESAAMAVIACSRHMLTVVNKFLEDEGKDPLFEIQLVGAKKDMQLKDGMFFVQTDKLLKDVERTDLIIIPPLYGDIQAGIAENTNIFPWLVEQYAKGAEIASCCLGAFLLAPTGLVNGKKCSTHWGFINEFREMFPDVEVVDGSIVTEESGIYSSGGANSFWNLLLHLVEKYTDRGTAILAAKYFAVDIDRNTQAPFAIFKGQKSHKDDVVIKAQHLIENNIDERFTIDMLADKFNVGRRSFERRFKQATNNSVMEYIHRVKVEVAKRSFESSRKNINEVMYDVGYTDTKSFRIAFKKITGLTPIEYRNKYNKMA